MKYHNYISVIFLFCFLNATRITAQNRSADIAYNKFIEISNSDTSVKQYNSDLESLLKIATTDTTKLYIEEGLEYTNRYNYPDTALIYSQQALQLALKINSKKDLLLCYGDLGEIFRILGEYPRAIEMTLKSISLSNSLGNNNSSYIYRQLGKCYIDDDDYSEAQNSLSKALSYLSKPWSRSDSNQIETNYIYTAELYEKKLMLDSALYYGKLAYKLDRLLNRN